ncbi:Endo-1-3(4)-beta-glucanase [Penicillium argentinense]|uniref:Endo-1-3(4)-beta-glucanase n=1 Tax=Penicillium argentinense TaxID=1131581 RepID=A0A9W9K9R9_9EURO|nr:Endo-1-3(4)-beta-glucanase [Penicillium argentinense]KAJ5098248.1 Endo-1-3(4)-beta-glucanase [Penicillium argentinense]
MRPTMLWSGILSFASLLSNSTNPSSQVNATARSPSKKSLFDCDCFTVSGPDPGYYQHYKLWDFRSVHLKKPIEPELPNPDYDDDDDDDEWEDDDEDDGQDEASQPVLGPNAMWFFETTFDKDWMSQQWARSRTPNSPVDMVNSKRNVFFTRNYEVEDPHATYLALRTTRHENYTSTAEIETRIRNVYRCSLRVRLRILPAGMAVATPSSVVKEWPPREPQQHAIPALNFLPTGPKTNATSLTDGKPHSGACVGIFTYHSRNCESDIEILTSDPSHRVRYANQPDYDPVTDEMIPGASTIADLPVPWTDWYTHRLDWLSDISQWWVDDKIQETKRYQVPNLQSRLVINLWSDGGVWTGDMKLGDSIFLGIEYIELAYNRSSDGSNEVNIPPSQRHGGHQRPNVNAPAADIADMFEESWEPDTDRVTKAMKKNKKKKGQRKCKKGRKGDKCRKRKNKPKKPHKDPSQSPHEPSCQRACYIDGENFRDEVLG